MPRALQADTSDLQLRDATTSQYVGSTVRWGGRIVQVEMQDDLTCFEISNARLDRYGRPDWRAETGLRFMACRKGFHDPSVYRINRDVTFVGPITRYETRRVEGKDSVFPRVDAATIYLWPDPPATPRRSALPWWWS